MDFASSAPATVEQYLTTVESLLELGLDDADLKRAMSDLSFEIEPDRFGYTNSGWLAATVHRALGPLLTRHRFIGLRRAWLASRATCCPPCATAVVIVNRIATLKSVLVIGGAG